MRYGRRKRSSRLGASLNTRGEILRLVWDYHLKTRLKGILQVLDVAPPRSRRETNSGQKTFRSLSIPYFKMFYLKDVVFLEWEKEPEAW